MKSKMLKYETRKILNSFRPRKYQEPICCALENKGYKKIIAILPRRAGKDIVAWNLAIRQCIKKTCIVYYIFPTYSQAKKVIWDSVTNDGMKFTDYIPDELIKSKNSQDLKITFANGSILQLIGSDNIDSLVGTNPYGCVFSEYAIQDPKAYQFIRPILAANDGWALFISCVSPDTLVITENGLRRISNVSDSRKEYTELNKPIYGLGGFNKATDFYYGGKQDTLKITLQSGYEIECTPIHPLWNGKEWVKARDIKIGDLFPVQYGQQVFGKGLDLKDFQHNKRFVNGLPISPRKLQFFYLLGLIHAEGSYDKNKVTVTTVVDKEIKIFLAKNKFKRYGKDSVHYSFGSQMFCSFLEYIGFKHGARHKTFPDKLFDCTKEQLRAFLQGIFDGDGCSDSSPSKRGRVKYTSSCKSFIKDLQVVLLNFGIVSSFRKELKSPTKLVKVYSTIYNLEITGYFACKFYKEVGFKLSRKQNNFMLVPGKVCDESRNVYPVDSSKLSFKPPKNIVTNPSRISRRMIKRLSEKYNCKYLQSLLVELLFFSPIQSIEASSSEVYDFVIPSTHSFFSGGFVSHNTPRGKNHFWELYQIAQEHPDWFAYKLTLDDTQHIPYREIERERAEGLMSEDLIQQEYYCFPGSQQVLTNLGIKNISDICENDMVYSHSGRLRTIKKKLKRKYSGELVKIRTYGTYEELVCTPNHPIRVYSQKDQTYLWKSASDISLEDRLVFPKKRLSNIKTLSYDLCMLLAWYISDGSSFKNGLQFTVHKRKSKRVQYLLNNLGLAYNVIPAGEKAENIIVNSVFYIDFFKSSCGSICYEKKIPFELILGHESDFFHELMKGDGCFSVCGNKEKYSFSTTSKHLAYQIQFLANSLNLGYAAGITKRLGGYATFSNDKTYATRDSYSVQVYLTKYRDRKSMLTRAKYGIAAKIMSINSEPFSGTVYNLQVQYDESYIISGRAVHNCSFTMGVEGAYYAKYIDRMRVNSQIGQVPYEIGFKVHTAWDLGVRDSTTIIFFQVIGQAVRIIDCYENCKEGLEHYAKVISQKDYIYGKHIAPHDIKVKEFGSGMTRIEKAKQLGIKFTVAPSLSVEDGIESVRSALSKIWIDNGTSCASFIKAIENYRQEYDSKKRVYKQYPLHDWSSHWADALRYMCISLPKTRDGLSAEELDKRYQEAMYGTNKLPDFFR